MNHILVTGGAGFIGSCLVRRLVATGRDVVTLDMLTYAGHVESLGEALSASKPHSSGKPISATVKPCGESFAETRPDAVIHLAAESHVDRSIDSPMDFVTTNVHGTVTLLQAATEYWRGLGTRARETFRFLHVSTDEVYGSLGATGVFTDTTQYQPNSPYSASKAASDHFARAWQRTFGLPVMVSHCSNNYGPYQMPEKLIPVAILAAPGGKARPCLRRRQECARLALRRRPRTCAGADRGRGKAGSNLQRRSGYRVDEHRLGAGDLWLDGRTRAR